MGSTASAQGSCAVDRARQSLHMLVGVDAVMLALPLFVLASTSSTSTGEETVEACGWTSASLHTTCIAAICCLCFSFILTGMQLIMLGASGAQQSRAFAQRLLSHLPLPIIVTAVGSLVGAVCLWGHTVLQHAQCHPEALILLASAFTCAYGVAFAYLYISPVVRGGSACVLEACLPLLPVARSSPCSKDSEWRVTSDIVGNQPTITSAIVDDASPVIIDETAPTLLGGDRKSEPELPGMPMDGTSSRGSKKGRSSKQSRSSQQGLNSERNSLVNKSSRSGSLRSSIDTQQPPTNRRTSNDGMATGKRNSMGSVSSKRRRSSQGVEGKCASPTTETEAAVGVEKPDRFQNVFNKQRKSLGLCLDEPFVLPAAKEARKDSIQSVESTKSALKSSSSSEAEDQFGEEAEDKFGEEDTMPESLPKRASLHDPNAKPRRSILITSSSQRNNATGDRKSVSILETKGMTILLQPEEFPDDMPPCKRDSYDVMLGQAVHHMDANPINFNTLGIEESSGSESDADGDPHVAVPLWVLDQQAQRKQEEEEEESGSEEWSMDGDEDDKDEGEEDDIVPLAPLPSALSTRISSAGSLNSEQTPTGQKKRISFFDQEHNTVLPQYSKETKKSLKEKKTAKQAFLSVRSGSAPASMLQNADFSNSAFWKVPRPTKRGTMMPSSIVRGALDQVPDEDEDDNKTQANTNSHISPVPNQASTNSHLLGFGSQSAPVRGGNFRRPSALAVFSESGVKKQGHYELPTGENEKGKKESGVVQVRRQSLVMTSSMMSGILSQKLERDGLGIRDIDPIAEQEEEAEIVLPFFVAKMRDAQFKKCNCKIDPETGFVLHTCMTPCATMCDNTQAFQSYVCSEWGSRRNSKKDSVIATKRRSVLASNSSSKTDGMTSDEDSDEELERISAKKKAKEKAEIEERMKNKRIRNASMLAVVGRAAPAPAKQDTDAPAPDPAMKEASDSDEDKPEENELHVSFQSLKRSDTGGRLTIGNVTEDDCTGNEDNCSGKMRCLDLQVESELGHRFELVQPWEMAQILDDSERREQVLVVDARGRDWVGAHIPLSINLRTSELTSHPESLIKQCHRNRIDHLVFTCMYSVLRARKSAVAVQRAQDEAKKAGCNPYPIRISLLAGGMHGWVNYWVSRVEIGKNNPYVQDYDEACWCDGGPSQGGLVHVMDALWCEGGQQALSDALGDALAALGQASPTDSKCTSAVTSTTASRRESALKEVAPPQEPTTPHKEVAAQRETIEEEAGTASMTSIGSSCNDYNPSKPPRCVSLDAAAQNVGAPKLQHQDTMEEVAAEFTELIVNPAGSRKRVSWEENLRKDDLTQS